MEKQSDRQLSLFGEDKSDEKNIHREYLEIPKFQAVVAKDNDQVFSVVTGNYHLVTNENALQAGQRVFPAGVDAN